MEFFRADKSDTETLVQARVAYLLADHGEVPREVKEALPGYFAEHLNADLFAYLCMDGDVLAGSAFLLVTKKPPSPAFPSGRVGSVLNVYTAPEYRRRGIAKTLMTMLIKDGAKMKLDHIELKAANDGYPLYSKLGFTDEISHYQSMRFSFGQK